MSTRTARHLDFGVEWGDGEVMPILPDFKDAVAAFRTARRNAIAWDVDASEQPEVWPVGIVRLVEGGWERFRPTRDVILWGKR